MSALHDYFNIESRRDFSLAAFLFVGAEGFEPSASCSQSKRAAGLRYAPIVGRV